MFIWAILAGPSAAAFAILLAGLRRRLEPWSSRTRFLSGLALGLAVGVVAGVGLWEDLGSVIFPGGGLAKMIATSALFGVGAAVILAAVAVAGAALTRRRAVSN